VNTKYLGADLITSEGFGVQDGNLSSFPAMLNRADTIVRSKIALHKYGREQ
jgi:hypothetical protein